MTWISFKFKMMSDKHQESGLLNIISISSLMPNHTHSHYCGTASNNMLHVFLQQHVPLSVWLLILGRPFCRRSLSWSLSFLSCERDRHWRSLERERRCLDILERDVDRDLLLLGDLKHKRLKKIKCFQQIELFLKAKISVFIYRAAERVSACSNHMHSLGW